MHLLKSIYIRKYITIFFLISYTFALLTFSIGSAAISSQKEKAKKIDPLNNISVSFIDCIDIDMKKAVEILDKHNVGIILSRTQDEFTIQTVAKFGSIEMGEDMKLGNYFDTETMNSDEEIALISNRLEGEGKIKINSLNLESFEIEPTGVFFDTQRKIIIPYRLFIKHFYNSDINVSSVTLRINGDPKDLDEAIEDLNIYSKSILDTNTIRTYPYMIEDSSIQGQALISSTVLIIIITIINSISLSALWVESRKKEIALRKVFGAENKDITKIFFGELFVISILSIIFAFTIHLLIVKITGGNIVNMNINLKLKTCIYSTVLAMGTAYISSLPSLKYLKKVHPVELLKEE